RNRPDRRRSDRLWGGSAGAPNPRTAGAAAVDGGAGAAPAAPLLARPERNRRRVVDALRRRDAADAAPASVAAVGRRSEPEADEAAAQPRRGDRSGTPGARPAPRSRDRRRSDRRVSDRDRRDVPTQPRSR